MTAQSNSNSGGAAFPQKRLYRDSQGIDHEIMETGLTLRDWFAGQALPTIIEGARKILIATEQMPSADRMARAAYVLADAMLAERAKE